MNFIKAIFRTDKEYKDILKQYNYKDGISAIVFYVLVMVLYYLMGVLYDKKNIYLGYELNFFLMILCILFVMIRKQPIKTIGFGKKNLLKSLILGLVPSAVIISINLISGILGGYHLNTALNLILSFGYYFFVIALMEEIIFRGFIQTRIYGIIQKPFFAVMVTAFMFMMFHVPFQMGASHMGFLVYISNNYVTLLFTFLWHIAFNFLYAKYNSIAGPTVFHAVIDWCGVLFK